MKRRRLASRIRGKNNFFKAISMIFLILIISILCYFAHRFYVSKKNKEIYDNIIVTENDIISDSSKKKTENMKKVEILKSENTDIIGWIQIKDSIINYPLLQTINDDYYLNHNYRKENSKYGSIFLSEKSKLSDVNSNLIIYGHNMEDGQMFSELLNFMDRKYYDTHKIINISTVDEDSKYCIIAVFKSKVFFEDENDAFRYYNYSRFNSSDEYDKFVNNCKALALYDTGITAKYGEQLITLVTCEYSQKNGRLVIIAKKIL